MSRINSYSLAYQRKGNVSNLIHFFMLVFIELPLPYFKKMRVQAFMKKKTYFHFSKCNASETFSIPSTGKLNIGVRIRNTKYISGTKILFVAYISRAYWRGNTLYGEAHGIGRVPHDSCSQFCV